MKKQAMEKQLYSNAMNSAMVNQQKMDLQKKG